MKKQETRRPGLLRLPQLLERIPFSRPTIDRLERRGLFPKRHHAGRIAFWIESEIEDYLVSFNTHGKGNASRDQSTVNA